MVDTLDVLSPPLVHDAQSQVDLAGPGKGRRLPQDTVEHLNGPVMEMKRKYGLRHFTVSRNADSALQQHGPPLTHHL